MKHQKKPWSKDGEGHKEEKNIMRTLVLKEKRCIVVITMMITINHKKNIGEHGEGYKEEKNIMRTFILKEKGCIVVITMMTIINHP